MCKARTHRGFAVSIPEFVEDKTAIKYVSVGGFRETAIKLANRIPVLDSAAAQLDLIELAVQTFKVTEFSFKAQIDGRVKSTEDVVMFVRSTLEYIVSGERTLPAMLWYPMLEYAPENYALIPDTLRREVTKLYSDLLDLSPADLIRRWVAQPGGMEDLAITLDLIFSEPGSDEEQPVMYL